MFGKILDPNNITMSTEVKYCECCGQKTMIYQRKIRSALINGLKILYMEEKKNPEDPCLNWRGIWVTDIKILKFWGFIYPKKDKPSYFGITEKGKRFLRWEIRVPKTAFVYNNELQAPPDGYKEEWVHINDVQKGEPIDQISSLAEAIPFTY